MGRGLEVGRKSENLPVVGAHIRLFSRFGTVLWLVSRLVGLMMRVYSGAHFGCNSWRQIETAVPFAGTAVFFIGPVKRRPERCERKRHKKAGGGKEEINSLVLRV